MTAFVIVSMFVADVFSQSHFSFTSNTGNNMTVLVKSTLRPSVNGRSLSNGDEIGIFTTEGLCVGAAVWSNKNAAITVWGDNEQTPVKDGAKAGETLIFRVWDALNAGEVRASVTYASGGPNYSADGIAILSTLNCMQEAIVAGPTVRTPSFKKSGADTADSAKVVPTVSPVSPVTSETGRSTSLIVDVVSDISPVVLVEPTAASSSSADSIVLTWRSAGKNVQRYWVELAQDSSMKKAIVDSTLSASDTSRIFRSLSNGTFYWRVRSGSNGIWGPFSTTSRFEIGLPDVMPEKFDFTWHPPVEKNSPCSIDYTLPAGSSVTFTLSDHKGKIIRKVTDNQTAGPNTITMEPGRLRKGRYSYTLETDFFIITSHFSVNK